jgi:hypothetical protein
LISISEHLACFVPQGATAEDANANVNELEWQQSTHKDGSNNGSKNSSKNSSSKDASKDSAAKAGNKRDLSTQAQWNPDPLAASPFTPRSVEVSARGVSARKAGGKFLD